MKVKLGKLEIEVKEFPFKLYDKNGNIAYLRNSNGYEGWCEYDKNRNVTYYRDSDDYEWWCEYDGSGNITYYRNSDGYERWKEYDNKGNETYFRDSTGYECGTPRSKSCEGKVVEIDGKKYQLKEIK